MNVYQKLAEARVQYQAGNPKMSGENTFAKYKYFELADITPLINTIGKDIGFVCEVSFTETLGTLLFRDTDKPEDFITFTSPMSTASLKGCHEVQNLGAVETYIKRYLYQNAFEIVEADALNGTQAGDTRPPAKTAPAAKPVDLTALKQTLIDYVNEEPAVLNPAWIEYANKAMAANNVDGIQKSIAEAVKNKGGK